MTDKNLTDNEIVKALKEILEIMLTMGDLQKSATISNALDLINRQKAENERLRNVKSHIDILIHRGVEYPTSETYNEAFQKALEKLYDNDNAKAEAYKEFAEKVISKIAVIMKHIEQNPYDSRDETRGTICGLAHAIGQIKDLLKEMEGGASEVED